MLVKPDFSEIQDEVSPGEYTVMIKKGTPGEWPSGGAYVNWELETFGEADAKNNGRKVFYKTSLSGKAAFMLQRFFKAATGEVLKGQFDTEQLVGRKVKVKVVDGTNKQGEPTGYTDIKSVSAV